MYLHITPDEFARIACERLADAIAVLEKTSPEFSEEDIAIIEAADNATYEWLKLAKASKPQSVQPAQAA